MYIINILIVFILSMLENGINVYSNNVQPINYNKIICINESIIDSSENYKNWGEFQFPELFYNRGILYAKVNIGRDNISGLGKGINRYYCSNDSGRSWVHLKNLNENNFIGIEIDSNCYLNLFSSNSKKILLDSFKNNIIDIKVNSYSKNKVYFIYDLDLPLELQGLFLARKCGNVNKPYRVIIKDSCLIKYISENQLPFMWWGSIFFDNNTKKIYAAMYPEYIIENDVVQPSGIGIYVSNDNGHIWQRQSVISYVSNSADSLKLDEFADGFSEPSIIKIKNGDLICVIRSTNGLGNKPIYQSRSIDEGLNWSSPSIIISYGVKPQIIQLGNGLLVLSTGRPGIKLFVSDNNGLTWSKEFIVLHDSIPTCGYTGLKYLGNDKFNLIYSDFSKMNKDGNRIKSIISKTFIIN